MKERIQKHLTAQFDKILILLSLSFYKTDYILVQMTYTFIDNLSSGYICLLIKIILNQLFKKCYFSLCFCFFFFFKKANRYAS